jgi:hypothetical protein
VRAGVFGAAALSLTLFLAAVEQGLAQAPPLPPPPPLPGFVPPYEITMTVRSAGFYPLAPPRREGTTYVLRATDFRGILMRVVVDARSGAIRAVNRIVPAPGPYGAVGVSPYGMSPYGEPPPYRLPPYGGPAPYGMVPAYAPPDVTGVEIEAEEARLTPPAPIPQPPLAPSFALSPAHTGSIAPLEVAPPPLLPPLPRPRPADLAARDVTPPTKGPEAKGMEKAEPPAAKGEAKPETKPETKPEAKPSASATTPPATTPAAPSATAPPKRPQVPQLPD